MLDALRRGTASWVAKGLLFLLMFSFAIWGVADVFRGYQQGSLATVGKIEISEDDYRRSYQLQLDDLRRRFQNRITPEQARMFGLDQQVLSRLVGAAAIDSHAKELNLALSPDAVAQSVRRDPMFTSQDGTFNRLAFESALRQGGISEPAYLTIRRKDEVRDQLTDSVLESVNVPATLIDILWKYREEKRTVSHFTIDAAKAVKLAEPDEAKLKETYEANKAQFVVPELRKLEVLLVTLDGVKAALPVTDEEVKTTYERDKERFNIPERRKILQIPFKDRAAAEAARAAIVKGKSFEDAAKEAGASASDIDLGLKSKKELIDAKIADAAFALAKDGVSEVVEGMFTTVVVKVTEIQPGRQKPLDEVKAEIRDRLAAERAGPEIQRLHDQVDDLRSAGKPMAEIASTLKVKLLQIAETDSNGRKADGKPAFEGPDGERIVKAAFEAKEGAEGEAVELGDGGYAWVDVKGVTKEKQKAFEEVKEDVKAVWRDIETRTAVGKLASDLADRASKGESLDELAKLGHGKVEVATDIKRFGAQGTLPEGAVSIAFATAKGKAASAEAKEGANRIVLRVDGVTVPAPPSKEDADRLKAEVQRQMQGDILAEYVASLQDRLGVTINQQALRRATGADQAQ